MNNLYKKYSTLNRNNKDSQFLISTSGKVKAYFGINKDGLFRLSFLSSRATDITGDTKSISVTSGSSSENNYWTCFDLMNESLLQTFCTFSEDLVSCVVNEQDEDRAIYKLRARFFTWLALFKKTRNPLSIEQAKGLFGELYFMDCYLFDKYGESKTINGWSGPERFSKDFSIDEDWYEIKTKNALATTVKISSIQQLSSDKKGRLVVVSVEEMSDEYGGFNSSINELCVSILARINDNANKDEFLNKVSEAGYDFTDDIGNKKFNVTKIDKYIVDNDFPIIKENDLISKAISNVSYDLIINMLDKYKEE